MVLDGRPYRRARRTTEVRDRLAYVEQETPIVPGHHPRTTCSSPSPAPTERGPAGAARRAAASRRSRALADGLSTPRSASTPSPVGSGSGSRSPAPSCRLPEVLLLDEATAQVDGLTEAAIQDCIRGPRRQGAVLTIAHRLSTVIDADRSSCMEAGPDPRPRARTQELLGRDELYRQLVEALRIAATTESEPAVPALG